MSQASLIADRRRKLTMKIHVGELERAGTVLAPYLTPEELADQLQICKRTLDRWHAARRGPPRIEIGRRPMYRREAVEQWLIKRERGFDDDRKTLRR
jgi:predicted DNA-binding transcriptional regulator AlpA